jgi:hypothetical protein
MGPVSYFLGVQIDRNRKKRTIRVHQTTYIRRLLESNNLWDVKPTAIPLNPGFPKIAYELSKTANHTSKTKIKDYQHLIGGLMYTMTQTRPDLAYTVAYMARFLQNPTETHLKAVKGIFRYLRGCFEKGILYDGKITPSLVGYSDSDFAGDYTTRKSTYGYLFTMCGGPISWKSKLQSTIALSTTEAEFNGLEQATREAVWLKNLLNEIGITTDSILLKGDNLGAINLSHNPEYHQRTKHTAIRYYYVRQEIEAKNIKIEYIPTTKLPADGLTKPLPKEKFCKFIHMLSLQ